MKSICFAPDSGHILVQQSRLIGWVNNPIVAFLDQNIEKLAAWIAVLGFLGFVLKWAWSAITGS